MGYNVGDFQKVYDFIKDKYGLNGNQSSLIVMINDSDIIPDSMKGNFVEKVILDIFDVTDYYALIDESL